MNEGNDSLPEPHIVRVSGEANVVQLGIHLFELFRTDAKANIALTAVGPVTLQKAFRGVIELNARLSRQGAQVMIYATYEETQVGPRYESINRLQLIRRVVNLA